MAQHRVAEYDVIIVGGGTSGCVLANRLSEDPNVSVLVLEAGNDHSDDSRIYTPGLAGSMWEKPEFDWQYVAEPSSGINERSIKHPRGRIIGGTSSINSFALIYPSAAGIDVWAELENEGWDWDTLAPYYLKFQTIVAPDKEIGKQLNIAHNEESIRKSSGPVQASFPVKVTEVQKAWVDTFRTLGLNNSRDPLDGHALGGHTSTCHITGDRHERSHAGVAYLDPVLDRANLTVITNAFVRQLTIDTDSSPEPIVRGVIYSQNGVIRKVCAKNEVILTAGTFNTPQILELSGIGDPDILSQHGIDVVHANPAVGENLQDHLRCGISFELSDDLPLRIAIPADEARKQYEKTRSGPWAEAGTFAFSYTPLLPFLNSAEKSELTNLLEEHLKDSDDYSPTVRKRYDFIRKAVESVDEATATTFLSWSPSSDKEGNFVTLSAMLSHPFSTGNVHITSADPQTKPKIDFNYYSHALDAEIHARHIRVLEKLAKTEPLASLIKAKGKRLPDGYPTDTVDDAKEFLRAFVSTNYHPCGTCSLGPVVDSRLNVKGVRHLRVVDASIMPIIPRGNIITTVYAVAERAADLISKDLCIRRSTAL